MDGLHQPAGAPARKVFELHSTAPAIKCTQCEVRSEMAEALARVVPVTRRPSMTPVTAAFMNGFGPYALDPGGRRRLWEESLTVLRTARNGSSRPGRP